MHIIKYVQDRWRVSKIGDECPRYDDEYPRLVTSVHDIMTSVQDTMTSVQDRWRVSKIDDDQCSIKYICNIYLKEIATI